MTKKDNNTDDALAIFEEALEGVYQEFLEEKRNLDQERRAILAEFDQRVRDALRAKLQHKNQQDDAGEA